MKKILVTGAESYIGTSLEAYLQGKPYQITTLDVRDQACQIAQKAKAEGARQFILMSSMRVYGMDAGVITPETAPGPVSFYGKSRLAAEELVGTLADPQIRVQMKRHNLRKIRSYSIEAVTEQMARLYESVM